MKASEIAANWNEARPVTFREVSAAATPLGVLVSWGNLLTLIDECRSVHVVFGLKRSGESSCRSMEVTKDQARQTAVEGIRWSAENQELQQVRVCASGGTLWFGYGW
jgi:hypothetical protein